jgi:DegV family protein with EDD domain
MLHMSVRIVTDSTADLPAKVIQELGITVIPLQVNFGTEVYRDGVDLKPDEFYRKLVSSSVLPTTSVPPPGVFTEVYEKLGMNGDNVLSIHISSKLSGTYNSARLASKDLGKNRVEIIDSSSLSMGMGILVIVAARAARTGASLEEVVALVHRSMKHCYLVGLLDTLVYLQKGGRIGRARAFLGHVLNLKPLLTIRDGEVYPMDRVRTRHRALNKMLQLMLEHQPFDEVAVLHSAAPEEAEQVAEQLATFFPRERIHMSQFGPVLGTHIGPGAVGVGVLQKLPEGSYDV